MSSACAPDDGGEAARAFAAARAVPPAGALRQRLRRAGLRAMGALHSKPAAHGELCAVLLIRPDHLGDVLFLTPALHAVRQALPRARITLLAGPWGAEAVRGNPDLDAVRLCAFPGFERRPKESTLAPYRLLWATARMLRAERYDAAVTLRFDHWWGAWLAAAADIPRRIGYAWPETRPFLTESIPYQPGRHEVLQNATVLARLAPGIDAAPGATHFAVAEADRAWVTARLAAQGLDPGCRLVVIHPGAGAAVKQWPPACWAQVAAQLAGDPGAQIVLTGGPSERGLTAAVIAAAGLSSVPPMLDLAGCTTVGQLAALYQRAALVLGSDSGPLHLAVAAGAPTVHLYGPVPAAKFGPWGDPSRHIVIASSWICAPCDRLDWPVSALAQHACMSAIAPDRVVGAARALLG